MTEPSPAENPIDLPTGEPIPAPPPALPSAAAAASSSSNPSTPTLKTLLTTAPANTDAFLQHLQRCLATPGGIDTTLLFVCYTARLSGALLHSLAQALLRRSARELVALMFTLPPRTTILFSSSGASGAAAATAPPVATARAAAARLAALLAARLKNLGGLASEARTIARLWALLGMYLWARRLTLQLFSAPAPAPSSEHEKNGGGAATTTTTTTTRLATLVSWAQLLSCTAFQYLENGAYLSGKGVLGWTPREQARAYVVGSRWLGVYTALELGKLLAEVVARRQGGVVEETAQERAEGEAVRRSLVINLAWAPLTLHWGTENGFLSDAAVGLGGCIPGLIQMRKLWRDTAQ